MKNTMMNVEEMLEKEASKLRQGGLCSAPTSQDEKFVRFVGQRLGSNLQISWDERF